MVSYRYYLAKAQPQCPMAIGRDDVLSTLCHSCRFARNVSWPWLPLLRR